MTTTPTPTDDLRAAAASLRTTAGSATEGPWALWRDLDHRGFITVGDAAGVLSPERPHTEECNPIAHVYTEEDAAHITLMNPATGLALAEWLDEAARFAALYADLTIATTAAPPTGPRSCAKPPTPWTSPRRCAT
ncbi:hypothetical protein [Streptomyces sp. PTD5-9]|uniref:hypothetical protein n=1 Tax=Streptomyces sp. PTD5-9 TaxID=3120150 RepID=UPI00300B570A